MAVRVLTEGDLRKLVPLDRRAVEVALSAFERLADGSVEMPPVLSLRIPQHRGEVDVKTAFVPGIEHLAVKISPGFFDNPQLGLPSLNGLVVVLAANTGLLAALLLDHGYLTDIRTAAAGAVASDLLARPNSEAIAVLGTGRQAYLQAQALTLVRPIKRARVWGRRLEAAELIATRLTNDLGLLARAAASPRDAVDGADIIVTTTPAEKPILSLEWLSPGQHITAMGADAEYKNEIDPRILAVARPYVPDRQSQCLSLGELRSAVAIGAIERGKKFSELGDLLRNPSLGRQNDNAITLADLTGTGVQDTAIAALALRQAEANGVGLMLDI